MPFDSYPIISFPEVIDLKKEQQDLTITLLDSKNRIISPHDLAPKPFEFYESEFRQVSSNVVLRRLTVGRPSIEERLSQVLLNHSSNSTDQNNDEVPHDLDCNRLKPFFDSLVTRDQFLRKEISARNITAEEFRRMDTENISLALACINKCGIRKEVSHEIWLLIQHAPLEYQLEYYPTLERMYIEGSISGEEIALLRDRILIRAGYHQEYGTQGVEGRNFKIYDFKNVDSLRREMGMIPLKEYHRLLLGDH